MFRERERRVDFCAGEAHRGGDVNVCERPLDRVFRAVSAGAGAAGAAAAGRGDDHMVEFFGAVGGGGGFEEGADAVVDGVGVGEVGLDGEDLGGVCEGAEAAFCGGEFARVGGGEDDATGEVVGGQERGDGEADAGCAA